MTEAFSRKKWINALLLLLLLLSLYVWILGIHALHVSPSLTIDSVFLPDILDLEIVSIGSIQVDASFSYRLPEFFLPKEEAGWWEMQREVYGALTAEGPVEIKYRNKNGTEMSLEAMVGPMSMSDVLRTTGLIYLVALVYLISAVSVYRKYIGVAGTVLTFFFLFCALYAVSAAPVVGRTLTMNPHTMNILIQANHLASGGLITLVHFAFLFPRPKGILTRFRWIPLILYGYSLIAELLYLFGMSAYSSSVPFLFVWTLVMMGAVLHSLVRESDPFLKKQTRLVLLAPLLVALVFILLNVLPSALGNTSMRFTYFILISLILPFALVSAMDNLHLYEDKLESERQALMEKERIRQELHDSVSNDLTSIRFLSEVVERSLLSGGQEALKGSVGTIKETAVKNIERLRDFLWAMDQEEPGDLVSHLKTYAARLFNAADIEMEFRDACSPQSIPYNTSLRFNLFNIFKEAITNTVKHSGTRKVEISVSAGAPGFEMRVRDHGIGFDPLVPKDGSYGLVNMKRRALAIGAVLEISSEPGRGTEFYLLLPENTSFAG